MVGLRLAWAQPHHVPYGGQQLNLRKKKPSFQTSFSPIGVIKTITGLSQKPLDYRSSLPSFNFIFFSHKYILFEIATADRSNRENHYQVWSESHMGINFKLFSLLLPPLQIHLESDSVLDRIKPTSNAILKSWLSVRLIPSDLADMELCAALATRMHYWSPEAASPRVFGLPASRRATTPCGAVQEDAGACLEGVPSAVSSLCQQALAQAACQQADFITHNSIILCGAIFTSSKY